MAGRNQDQWCSISGPTRDLREPGMSLVKENGSHSFLPTTGIVVQEEEVGVLSFQW